MVSFRSVVRGRKSERFLSTVPPLSAAQETSACTHLPAKEEIKETKTQEIAKRRRCASARGAVSASFSSTSFPIRQKKKVFSFFLSSLMTSSFFYCTSTRNNVGKETKSAVHVWEIMGLLLLGKNRKFVSDLTNIGHIGGGAKETAILLQLFSR